MKTNLLYTKRKIAVQFLLTLGLTLLLISVGYGQQTITGVVKDKAEDLPIPGVSVYQKNSSNIAITDMDGAFSIQVNSPESELVFSFIGFETQTIVVGDRSIINITMQLEDTVLEQVVVVGYGVQKKINLTGAVDQIGYYQR